MEEEDEEDQEHEIGNKQQKEAAKRFQCSICERTYNHKSSLKRHLKHHDPKETIKCLDCHQFFDCDKDLEEHNSKYHNETLLCNICGKSFHSKRKFENHIKVHDLSKKKYLCEFNGCTKGFEKHSRFVAHVNTHTHIKPYDCSRCKKTFSSKENLKRHTHLCLHEKVFSCSDCQKTFKSSGALSVHITSVHKDMSFVCQCGKVYKYRNGLLNHKQKKKHWIVYDGMSDSPRRLNARILLSSFRWYCRTPYSPWAGLSGRDIFPLFLRADCLPCSGKSKSWSL